MGENEEWHMMVVPFIFKDTKLYAITLAKKTLIARNYYLFRKRINTIVIQNVTIKETSDNWELAICKPSFFIPALKHFLNLQ